MSYRVSYSVYIVFFCFKQKTAYDMRISDWSSDVCSSDLAQRLQHVCVDEPCDDIVRQFAAVWEAEDVGAVDVVIVSIFSAGARYGDARQDVSEQQVSRSEEHTSELQSLMRISYAVFCLKKNQPPYTPLRSDNTMYINEPGNHN